MNKVGIELSVESGGFISGIASAERSVESLTKAMKEAKDEGRDEDFVRLQIQRDTLSASTSGFKHDTQKLFSDPRLQTTTTSGAAVLKIDSDQATTFKDLNAAIKKLTSVYVDQINNKDFQGASETFSQIQQKQGEYKKAVDETTAPEGMQSLQNSLKASVLGQIANSINDGFRVWAGSLDRSGIVSAYGGGDILGGRLAEKQRTANIVGGGAQAVFGLAGGIATVTGNPLLGVGLSAAGTGINTFAQGLLADDKTETAYAGLWQQRSADAMNLAALMGDPAKIRGESDAAYNIAADTAAKYGYSFEEGADAIRQALQQGLGKEQAIKTTEQVFQYDRSTGADRGTLSSVANMATRYGAGDALKAGWGGLGASGMSTGQYNEYLRAMQRVMEDGISKGFVRSSDDIAQNLTMLAQMTDYNPLWQGENGARRLSEMNAGLEAATGLRSSTDIRVFRAAQKVAKEEGLGDSYWEAMKIVQAGMGGEYGTRLLHETMKINMAAEGEGMEGVGESIRQQLGLNYITADEFLKDWLPYKDLDSKTFKSLWDPSLKAKYTAKPLPDASSPELNAAITAQNIANLYTEAGQSYWNQKMPGTLDEALKKATDELIKALGRGSIPPPPDTAGMSPVDAVKSWQEEYSAALESGNRERIDRAAKALELAQMEALSPDYNPMERQAQNDRALATVGGVTGKMYDGLFGSKEDKSAHKSVNSIFNTALTSGNEGDRAAAVQFADMLDSMQKLDKGAIDKYNKNDTWNQLGSAADINGLIEVLRALVLASNDLTDEMKKGIVVDTQ